MNSAAIKLSRRIIAISNHGTFLGGGEHSFLDLISNLPNAWEVMGISPQEGELALKLRAENIDTRVIPLPSIRPWTIIQTLLSLKKHLEVYKAFGPNLIYANGSRAALYGGIAGKLLKIPMIWHCRIATPDARLDHLLGKLSTAIIANSQATAIRFKPCFKEKITVVYNGIDLNSFINPAIERPALVENHWRSILVIARASRDKRHDIVIETFEKVADTDPNIHLLLLGGIDQLDPKWWEYIQKRSQNSFHTDRIHWMGSVEDVRPWYASAAVLLLISENESFGRVIVEAMSSGVPVVASQCGGIPEIVRHDKDGILIPTMNAEDYAGAISLILDRDDLRQGYIKSAQNRAQLFDLEHHVGKMVEVFDDIMDSK